ncbi:MAG: cobalt ECF transporter T component CbiQ [Sedimentisphaerales bacterium]|nr:cobalt ECF transporter T component CbiQ [Sedimentisphaerales bacterium]
MHHAQVDQLAGQRSPIHSLDARTKLIGTLLFTGFVISAAPNHIAVPICYAVWPFAILVLGRVSFRFVFRQLLLVSPFVLVLAASNLFYDRQAVPVVFGPIRFEVWGGLLRGLSIVIKFMVTMSMLIGLTATTRFNDLLAGLGALRVPRLFVMQLGFLYRYLFLLVNRADHILQARKARKLRHLGVKKEIQVAGNMIGALLGSSIDTAHQVTLSMQARGFDGRLHRMHRMQFGWADAVYSGCLVVFLAVLMGLQRAI